MEHETPSCSNVSRRLYRRLDPRLCARWWSRIWRLRARHDTLSAADPAGAGSKPDSSSTRVTLAGTHDQWAAVTARIPRPDRNRGMTPSCSSGVSAAPLLPGEDLDRGGIIESVSRAVFLALWWCEAPRYAVFDVIARRGVNGLNYSAKESVELEAALLIISRTTEQHLLQVRLNHLPRTHGYSDGLSSSFRAGAGPTAGRAPVSGFCRS
jgi:hypothetical protein